MLHIIQLLISFCSCYQVMVKLELNLPWKPILAWPWGVKYIIDPETFLVTKHIESWDIGAWDVSDCVVMPTRPYLQ